MNIPVFCGQEPSFMGGMFDDPTEYYHRTRQAQRLTGNPINNNDDHFAIYFHGELEDMMGFDIVSFVDGIMPKIKYGDRIKCIAITPDDIKHTSIIYVGRYKHDKKLYCLIKLENDPILNVEYEGGLVEFEYKSIYHSKCEGWDVDANEDGQFIAACEHEECRKKDEEVNQSLKTLKTIDDNNISIEEE